MGPARLLGETPPGPDTPPKTPPDLDTPPHPRLTICDDCPSAFCLNDTHCGCKSGYRPPAWRRDILDSCDDINECLEQPQPCGPTRAAAISRGRSTAAATRDVDECAEVGKERCGGGKICFNTPGSFECHCPPGYADTPDGNCTPVTVPPPLCSDDQSDCALAEALTDLYGLLRGGGDPHHILQELLAILDGAFGGEVGAVPKRHHWATMLLEATEGLVRGVGALLPPPAVTAITANATELRLAVHQGPPPGPVHLQVPGVQLDVPEEVAWDSDTGGGSPLLSPPVPCGHRLVTRPRPPGTSEVTLRFQHPPPDSQLGARVLCAFWDPQEKVWATAGCRKVTPHPGTPPGTTCACNHLTSFAVLMAFHELEDDWVQDLVTKVGLGVSVVSLVVAAATFLLCRALKGLRTTLHLHLSLSLLLAHTTFLLGIDRTQHPTACAVVAGVLHFSFLAAFCWMCLEGLHLYVLLVRVFVPSWLRVRHLLLAGYGLPALLVTIAAAAFPRGYGTSRYCWLSLERGFRWSFQAPVCLVIALNAVILVVTVWKLVQKFNDVNPDVGHLRKMRVLAATAAGQLCLLGTGWALGLGLGGGLPRPGGAFSPLPLLFCALNVAQGLFILLCHCLAHPQVRDAYRACLCPGTKRYSEFTSATSNTSNTRLSRQQTYT
ncbi:adhesion G protein-coupled receptor E5-like [Morphnus guianensis]